MRATVDKSALRLGGALGVALDGMGVRNAWTPKNVSREALAAAYADFLEGGGRTGG